MDWFHRRRHTPDQAPAVKEARAERDQAMAHADDAIAKADAVADAVIAEYADAEAARLAPRWRPGAR